MKETLKYLRNDITITIRWNFSIQTNVYLGWFEMNLNFVSHRGLASYYQIFVLALLFTHIFCSRSTGKIKNQTCTRIFLCHWTFYAGTSTMNLPWEAAIQEKNEKCVWHYDGQYRRPQTVQIRFYSGNFFTGVTTYFYSSVGG